MAAARRARSGTVSFVATLKRIAPIFPVRDLSTSLEHYRRLGFATRAYVNGGYGYATLDSVEIHLGVVPGGVSTTPDEVAEVPITPCTKSGT